METMEATDRRPQLLRTTDMDFDRVLNTKAAGSSLDMEGRPRHQLFQDIEKQGVPGGFLGVPKSENEGAGTAQWDDGSSNVVSQASWSPDASPATEDFPSKQLPARLQDSIGDIKCLQKGSDEFSLGSTSLELSESEVEEIWRSKDADALRRVFDALLVWLFNLKQVQQFLLQIKKHRAVSTTTVSLLLNVKPSALDPPQWLLIVLESSEWHGRWLNELSIEWVDTTWRTAFSALHVGSISPVASLPRVNPERLRALWSARRLITSTPIPVPAPEPSLVHTSIPCKACAPKRPATPTSSTFTGSSSNKKQKQHQGRGRGNGKGKGKARKEDEDPDDSFSDHDGPKRPRSQRKPKDGASNERHYACHYYKRYPLLHLDCLYHNQTAPRHVKRHLKRCHKQPIHCPICYESFKGRAACNSHIVQKNCCKRSGPNPHSDKISEDIEAALDDLQPGDGPAKWFEIWDALFPGVPRPASPFVEPDNYEGIVVASVGEHKARAFRDSLNQLRDEGGFTEEQVGIIMERFATTFGTAAPPATSSGSSLPPPAGQPAVPPPDGGGGHPQTPFPAPPTPQQQAESVPEPDQLLLAQLQQEYWQREQQRRFMQQQHQLDQTRLQGQYHPQYQQQFGFVQQNHLQRPSQVTYPSPSAFLPSRQFHQQPQNPMPPPPSAHHNSWSRFQHSSGPPGGNPSRQPSNAGGPPMNNMQPGNRQQATYQNTAVQYGVSVNTDASRQRGHNAMAHNFNHQYPDMAQAFGVPHHFLQYNMPQNAQFPGSDIRSQQTLANRAAALENNQHQIMMPDATLSQVINPRDLQIHPVTHASGPPEPESLAAEPAAAAAAAAPTGHDDPESDEEDQGSPDEPVDAAGYFYIPGIGGIGGEEEDDGELDLGGFNLP